MDIGEVFTSSAKFPSSFYSIISPYIRPGRYLPVYWLYHALLYLVSGIHVQGYFLVQSLIFLAGALTNGYLFTGMVRNRTVSMLFVVMMFISSPNSETLYTICKPEPIVFLLVSIILLLSYYGNADHRMLSAGKSAVIGLVFVCSLWTKETSLALFSFAIAGIAATLLLYPNTRVRKPGASPLHGYARLLFGLAFGFLLSKLPFVLFTNTAGVGKGTYTAYDLTRDIVVENAVFYLTQQPDVVVIGAIATFFVFILFRFAKSSPASLDERARYDLVFLIGLLAMAWSYCAIFLIWRWPMAYYLLLPAITFRFVLLCSLYAVTRLKLCRPRVRTTAVATIALLLLHASVYLWYTGSSQVRYSQVYSDALEKYAKLSHAGDSLTIESYPFYAEQVINTKFLLDLVYHEPRRLYGIADLIDPNVITLKMRQLLSITDAMLAANEGNVPKKGDYVLDITGDNLGTWQTRGVGPFYSDGSFLVQDGAYEMQELGNERSFFPAAFLNVWTHRAELRQTYIGYKIYRVSEGPKFTWLGRFPDGWMGRRTRLILYPEYVKNALVHVVTPKYNPINTLRLYRDDVLIDSVVLPQGKEQTFNLQTADRPTLFRFELDRTFVPSQLHLNRDDRELGALISLEPFAALAK